MAPEVFDITNTTVTDRADIYGFGVMMWEMLAAQRPWHGFTHLQIAVSVAVLRMRLPLQNITGTTCPVKLRSLIWSCWEPDPARRPAAAEVVKTLALVQEVRAWEEEVLGCVYVRAGITLGFKKPSGRQRVAAMNRKR
ncbi:hypothetical protein Vretifemale_10957 [Volvox reticuliferus]|uniref:Protein kinase domain-containing protein n=2 Tax=Volvox reticuliferus TaxID=1737510 RepID=A0A8J4FN70_9CHLO|nr:hypothetical protein Vretifemale_10957 [Volvox reticuliferus]